MQKILYQAPTPSLLRLSGWVVGWVGPWMDEWVGNEKKSPSIFLEFKYMNKQNALIQNLASKVVYNY